MQEQRLNNILFSSKRDNWETPKTLFDNLNNVYHFNVDLCADDNNHLCDEYYTEKNSCLDKDIRGKVIYCNPPYSREMYKFIEKCYKLSFYNTVVMLLPARTDTKWFHDFIYNKAEIRFIKGRLRFSNSKNVATFPSMIVIYRR